MYVMHAKWIVKVRVPTVGIDQKKGKEAFECSLGADLRRKRGRQATKTGSISFSLLNIKFYCNLILVYLCIFFLNFSLNAACGLFYGRCFITSTQCEEWPIFKKVK